MGSTAVTIDASRGTPSNAQHLRASFSNFDALQSIAIGRGGRAFGQ
jgi:hypothetical protein